MLLISQPDHAMISGRFAAQWGGPGFARPEPYIEVIRATEHHDDGWRSYEAMPRRDPSSGRPYTHRRMPFDPGALQEHRAAIEWMRQIDPYASLLMSMHRTGLSQGRYGVISDPSGPAGRELPDAEARFVAELEAAQRSQTAELDRERVWTNYRLLQVWDLLSLYLCLEEPQPARVGPAPRSYGGPDLPAPVLTLTPLDGECIRVDPYPFAMEPLMVPVVFRFLRQEVFDTDEEFRAAYAAAEQLVVTYRFVR